MLSNFPTLNIVKLAFCRSYKCEHSLINGQFKFDLMENILRKYSEQNHLPEFNIRKSSMIKHDAILRVFSKWIIWKEEHWRIYYIFFCNLFLWNRFSTFLHRVLSLLIFLFTEYVCVCMWVFSIPFTYLMLRTLGNIMRAYRYPCWGKSFSSFKHILGVKHFCFLFYATYCKCCFMLDHFAFKLQPLEHEHTLSWMIYFTFCIHNFHVDFPVLFFFFLLCFLIFSLVPDDLMILCQCKNTFEGSFSSTHY